MGIHNVRFIRRNKDLFIRYPLISTYAKAMTFSPYKMGNDLEFDIKCIKTALCSKKGC